MPERLTDARIDELLDLEAKATPGEWDVDETIVHGQNFGANGVKTLHHDGVEICRGSFTDMVCQTVHSFRTQEVQPVSDLQFIAASRNSIRSLLKEVRERRAAELEMLRALRLAESHYRQSENCGVCHPIGDCPTLRVISSAIARAEKEGKSR